MYPVSSFVVGHTTVIVRLYAATSRKNRNNVCWGQGSNPGEDMDVCKCIVPLRPVGTLNSRRAASPLMRLVEGGERPLTTPRVFSLKIGVKPR
ncbi:hypothetical protein TNCV_675161 [Trichonephila clavipes]|nr:hypothetical protein TNCV_675161 [Trichonephila clavipes]